MDRPMLLLIATVMATAVVWTWTRHGRSQVLRATARRAGLAVPAAAGPVARRLQVRRTAAAAGVVLGLALGTLVVPSPGSGEDAPSATVLLVVGLGFVGLALATAGHAVLASRRPVATDAPRVARGRDVGLDDYVNGFERRSMVVVSGLPTLVAVVAAPLLLSGLLDSPPVRVGLLVVLAVVPLLVLAGSIALTRVVLAARQPAGSTEDLAWDDALRALALRDVVSLPLYAGLSATVLSAAEVSLNLPPTLAPAATAVLVLGSLLAMAVVLAVSVASHPARHFRSRLWPLEQVGART